MRRRLMLVFFLLFSALVLALLFGPREPLNLAAARPVTVEGDPEAWIAAREAAIPALKAETTKRIAPAAPGRTPLAIVYIHGFSGSRHEISPVPEEVAAALGANLFLTRLTGHGSTDPQALAAATPDAWIDDLAEALAVGRALGEKVILIGTSTGGSLATLAAFLPEMDRDLAGIVLVSPNYGVRAAGANLLTLPFARSFVPWILGPERTWTPLNPGQASFWTTSYPSEALVPMAVLARAAHLQRFDRARVPALFIFADGDQVVDESLTRDVASRWGGAATLHVVTPGPKDDPAQHVIAGDILSPSLTPEVVAAIVGWARALQP